MVKNDRHIVFVFLVLIAVLLCTAFLPGCLYRSAPSRKPEVKNTSHKRNQHIVVLIYHHVFKTGLSRGQVDKMDIPLSEFENQMKFLEKNGYYTASLNDVRNFIYEKKNLPSKTVLVTFDDGYVSNYVNVFPVLKKYHLRATIFIVGSQIKKVAVNDPALINTVDRMPILSWSQVKKMKNSGLVEFGGHTFNAHKQYYYKSVLRTMTKQAIIADFKKEAAVFEANGLPTPLAIAYPYGQFNNNVLEASQKTGYKLGFTTRKGVVYQNTDPFKINRITVKTGTDINHFKQILNRNF